jgi:type II restriction/modification system DNA methylase subunit YeeA
MASNRNILKKYAPQARVDFIQAITNRAAQFGISKDRNVAGEVQGDLLILNGKAFPRSVANQRGRLIARIAREGFAQVMEAVAYTWFNRFLAIRYMELHHFLDHGYRVLSNDVGHGEPEILEKATTFDLPGIDRDEIVNLKLDGTKDEVIYRKLLIAQCNDLHRAMPFLFEKIDDETELLLPENLLQSDSIVRKLVGEIDEAEWQEIEIIGWLYQFYISDKKDQVMGKVVKSEDIPAATQLFTPNWIVKYMVQNSLGAQWLATYPDSGIRPAMNYYIPPAEQTPEVQSLIDAITPKQLDPEDITLIDPAVGSGHILVEAYDLFRTIYLERGYTKREAARAILTKNLFGLDIDDRAAQMAGFALLMKACADDRSVLRNTPKLNVLALQGSEKLDADALAKALLPQERFEMVPSGDLLPETLAQPTLAVKQSTSVEAKAIRALVTLFGGAKTFGSLITVPDAVMQSLPLLDALLAQPLTGDLYHRQAQEEAQEALKPLVEQARLLGGRYDCVVANPPYMGGKGMNADLKAFAGRCYPDSKADLFAVFIERNLQLAAERGAVAMITMHSWMFLSSYEKLRLKVLENEALVSMAHLGARGFDSIGGEVVSTTAFVLRNTPMADFKGGYLRLVDGNSEAAKQSDFKEAIAEPQCGLFYRASASDFEKVPGSPIAYWVSEALFSAFEKSDSLGNYLEAREGLATGNNEQHVRYHFEVSLVDIGRGCSSRSQAKASFKKWFSYNKGGEFRKWYGNDIHVVNWFDDGYQLQNTLHPSGDRVWAHNFNLDFIFRPCVSWSDITTRGLSVRFFPEGYIFDATGLSAFETQDHELRYAAGAICNSKVGSFVASILNPTLHFKSGDFAQIPFLNRDWKCVEENAKKAMRISKEDWDDYETSPEFYIIPLFNDEVKASRLITSYQLMYGKWISKILEIQRLEIENNSEIIQAYGLQDELTSDVPLSEITLTCNPHYRYGGDLTDEEREARLKSDTMRELVSYAVGCMMGRYSLAEPSLIYAHAGGVGFDPSRYGAFPADDDGIIPLTEEQWFADDAAVRIEEFLGISWPEAPVMETLTTLMDGLVMDKAGEPRAALRSYMSKQFYKDHLQTYKNRPIYWLFSSGKNKAFEALVYLHRYNEGTLARMRTIYVTPLMGKLQQRMADLEAEAVASSSSAETTRKNREKDKLAKQVVELRAFDEELRHLADQRIPLDLDDGVKVNYARFGNLLAAKDKVCPKKKGEDE